ncbi:hypothetical protein EFR01_38820 [Sinorhizobium fredii]|nr:hypothetical protein EFR01_38820 [Sinorhizobium fredii]GLS06756.1 hypothetical protein GCM10007864_03810 [Sinorhizobium fredii]
MLRIVEVGDGNLGTQHLPWFTLLRTANYDPHVRTTLNQRTCCFAASSAACSKDHMHHPDLQKFRERFDPG